MRLSKYAKEGEIYPKLYGFAYFDYMRRHAVCYPIGLNWIVNLSRKIWFILLNPSEPKMDVIKRKAYHDGYSNGFVDGAKK